MSKPIQHFGPRLRAFRNAKGLSQGELSKATGIDQAYISRMENGAVEGSTTQLAALARALSVTVSDILGDKIAEPGPDYRPPQGLDPRAAILSNYEAPPGLRDLATDQALIDALKITADEWARLAAVPLPKDVSKQGYMQLLVTLRAIVSAGPTLTS